MDQVLSEVARNFGRVALVASAALATFAACKAAPKSSNSDPRLRPGYVIDSALPPGEALRRFRAGLDSPATLDGPRTRDELVRRFMKALRQKDRPSLEKLAVTRAEFAYLVFPESRFSKPPYNQPPSIAWLLASANSDGALTKLIVRADELHAVDYRCEATPEREGGARLWAACLVRIRTAAGEMRSMRLFGSIIERDGRFKFASYANDL